MKKIVTIILLPFIFVGCSWFQEVETPAAEIVDEVNLDLVQGEKVAYGISYDDSKWSYEKGTVADEFEYQFEYKDGDVYAMVVTERLQVPVDSLKDLAFGNMKMAVPDGKLTFEETREVDGAEILVLQMEGTIAGMEVKYYGYYYSGDVGTIQFIAYTGKDLFSDYEEEIKKLLDGIEFYEAGEYVPVGMETVEGEELLVRGSQVDYVVRYDSGKWVAVDSMYGGDSEYGFEHRDGDIYAMVIVEQIEISLVSLKQLALDNALNVAPDAEIVFEEMRTVNGEEVLAMKIKGTIEGVPFQYYGYYYVGDVGSIQFVAYTGQALFDAYEDDMTELLEGLEVY